MFHSICRCTRWQETYFVDPKKEPDLLDAIDQWVARHGPFKELIGDGETSIAKGRDIKAYLERKGIKYIPRAPQQHAHIIERRGAFLRDVIHRTDAQLSAEGITDMEDSRLFWCLCRGYPKQRNLSEKLGWFLCSRPEVARAEHRQH